MQIWDYRVVGVNINQTQSADAKMASSQMDGMSQDFLKREFPNYYENDTSTNIGYQCQQVLKIYGKNGWEHYQQSNIGALIMLYFRKQIEIEKTTNIKLNVKEESILQSLNSEQLP